MVPGYPVDLLEVARRDVEDFVELLDRLADCAQEKRVSALFWV